MELAQSIAIVILGLVAFFSILNMGHMNMRIGALEEEVFGSDRPESDRPGPNPNETK